MTALPLISDIKRLVAREYGVTVAMLGEPRRSGCNSLPHSRPRQVAMTLACLLTDHSESRIGQFFNRHPTTVRHARNAVAERRRHDPKLHNAMRRMTLELVRG